MQMWTWSLNWGEITPHIVVGTCPMTAEDIFRIRAETRVSAVLSLQHDDCLAYWSIDYPAICRAAGQAGIEMKRCPIRDFDVADMRRNLPTAVSKLARLQAAGRRTYVHCTAGLGRSPLAVLAYLIWIESDSAERAIERVLRERPGAVPAWEALAGAGDDLAETCRKQIEQRAFELYRAGVHRDALADWGQARSEVIKAALLGTANKATAGR